MNNRQFERIKTHYDKKRNGYTDEGLKKFVIVGRLTEEQYKEITGIEYKK